MKVTRLIGQIQIVFEGCAEEYEQFCRIEGCYNSLPSNDIQVQNVQTPAVDINDPSTWPVFGVGDKVKYVREGVPKCWSCDWVGSEGHKLGDEFSVKEYVEGTLTNFIRTDKSDNLAFPPYHFDLVKEGE